MIDGGVRIGRVRADGRRWLVLTTDADGLYPYSRWYSYRQAPVLLRKRLVAIIDRLNTSMEAK